MRRSKRKGAALAVGALLVANLLSPGALAGDFVAYEGKDAIQEGTGGAKKTVDGIDFWSDGAPPRKFKLLGYITDKRLKSGLVGKIRMSGLEGSIAKEAKKAGGDAVILLDAATETTGYVGGAQTTGTSTSSSTGSTTYNRQSTTGNATPVQNQLSRYAVVKYIDDTAETPPADAAPESAKPE